MACIDKTYVNKEEFIEALKWCENVGEVSLENGYKFRPLNRIILYNDIDMSDIEGFFKELRECYILWATPMWFDRWLWLNCPLSFIRERLQQQYSTQTLKYFEEWEYVKPKKRKQKYTFLEVPTGTYWKWYVNHNCRGNSKQTPYHCEVRVPDEEFGRYYDLQTDQWYKPFDMLPACNEFSWFKHHKNLPTKKSIIRQLDKWILPKGSIVKVKNFTYQGLDYIILVK